MTVVFRTDGSVTRTGFRAVWEAVDNDGGGEQGEIESPNYPNLYDDNMDETWNIEVASDKRVRLTFQNFSLENGYCDDPSDYSTPISRDVSNKRHNSPTARCENYVCPYDWVQVSSGSVDEKYCGSDIPSPIISSGNTMTVVFRTDGSVTRTGFRAVWEAVDNDGGGEQGEIESPNYPNLYDDNMDETWNIEVASDKRVRLTFQNFSLENGYCDDPSDYSTPISRDVSNKRHNSPTARCENYVCPYDWVQVSSGSVDEKYCGSDMPGPIVSSGNTMTVTFVCDSVFQFTGFNITPIRTYSFPSGLESSELEN
jgi:cubilin